MIDVYLVLGALAGIVGALAALHARELMRGILMLAVFFLGLAVLFARIGAPMLAAGQLFLFVGGVVTLFVLAFNTERNPRQSRGTAMGVAGFILVAGVLAYLLPLQAAGAQVSLDDLAAIFFQQYGWVLNVMLLVLLSAVVGAQYVLEADR